MLAPILENAEIVNKLIYKCLDKWCIIILVIVGNKAIRISPPLNIKEKDIKKGCKIIREALDKI